MHSASKMFWCFQFALDEPLVDNYFCGDIAEFTPLPRLHLLSHRSKFRRIRSTPTEMQSIRENDFECFASTGVKKLVTM